MKKVKFFTLMTINLVDGIQKEYRRYVCNTPEMMMPKRNELDGVWINESEESLNFNEIENMRRCVDE